MWPCRIHPLFRFQPDGGRRHCHHCLPILTGQGQTQQTNRVFTQSMVLLAVVGLTLTLLTSVFIVPLARVFGATDTSSPKWWTICAPSTCSPLPISSPAPWASSSGRTATPVW
ncbi:MAG: hypothetical protein V8Q30_12540 [Acutalibacteraceae bacterium]